MTFTSVEAAGEAHQALGWNVEGRVMTKGGFLAEVTFLEHDSLSIMESRFERDLFTITETLNGTIGFYLSTVDRGSVNACGHALRNGDLIVFPTGSELEIVTHGEVQNLAVWLSEGEFCRVAAAIAPGNDLFKTGNAAIHQGDQRHMIATRDQIKAVLHNGRLDAETASAILANIILWMAESSSIVSAEQLLPASPPTIAKRAQDYIEAHYNDTIRMADLCASVEVGLRTLQRCFAACFQISPSDYIKMRRLSAARRELMTADTERNTVTTIALDNGFTHLGRFAVEYRAFFGESPRETLAAAKAGKRRSQVFAPPRRCEQ
ncbi:MAG: helix-turn-helix domain-containing protein [Acidobacteriota bacterium]|nr:helix-turn-helix domain-containing protein [Acidobacteriota bacterium]